jgi:oligopeptidase A
LTKINPLLAGDFRIPFDKIEAKHVKPGVEQALREAQADIDELSVDTSRPTWDNAIAALDRTVERLGERITPVTHLMSVSETPELREAYNAVLPAITAFWSRLPLNEALWQRVKAYAQSDEAAGLQGIRRRHLDKTVRDFERAGADLPAEAKGRLEQVRIELAQLQQSFSENVLDATAAFELIVKDEKRLAGVPEAPKHRARARAKERGKKGWLLTLDYPSVEPILKHCRDRELRQEIFVAFATRCRDGDFDNRVTLARILRLRDESAEILGYDDFPDYTLEDRMVGSGARAVAFEADLVARTAPFWERDVADLREHASTLGLSKIEPWDAAYLIDDLRRTRYQLDDEDLRPYFPLTHVLNGLFEVVRRTFGFRIEEREIAELWHEDVRYFEIFDDDSGEMLGGFYSDWFPRVEKREGAWMNNFRTGGPRPEGFAPHLGVICGNFTPPSGDHPALLTHREVETTFHEFGHLLHHCTSRVEVPARAGINVAWDWVELPSQLMENWTWEREALDLFARHYETGELLPDELFKRMIAARRFMGGWAQMRQLSLGTVDLALHGELAPKLRKEVNGQHGPDLDSSQGDEVMRFGEKRFAPFALDPRFAHLHMLTSFNHLFAGGYAAAYYSYLWSEVLDADVFTRFKREGIFNRETGAAYVEAILSRGDSEDPDDLFVEFMGRAPDPEALLARNLGTIGEA